LNKTIWFKTSVILVLTILAFFSIDEPNTDPVVFTCVLAFSGSSLITLLGTLPFWNFLSPNIKYEKPKWRDKLSATYPLTYFQFAGYLFIGISFGGLLRPIIEYGSLDSGAMVGLCAGLGLLAGIELRTNITSEKSRPEKKDKTRDYSLDKNHHEVFRYEFIPTYDKQTNDFMIRFSSAKNCDSLLGKLLMIFDRLDLHSDGTNEMIDEIWINAKSENGRITITRDNWDFVFILAENNKRDLERIEAELDKSIDFEKI
jgi:hypothetical protein